MALPMDETKAVFVGPCPQLYDTTDPTGALVTMEPEHILTPVCALLALVSLVVTVTGGA